MAWYLMAWRRMFDFSGRSRRREYWLFIAIDVLIKSVLGAIAAASQLELIGIVLGVYLLIVLIPTLAVTVRRLHDIGRTGWWLLAFPAVDIVLIFVAVALHSISHPYAPEFVFWVIFVLALIVIFSSIIVPIVFLTANSQLGENRYGPNPKGV